MKKILITLALIFTASFIQAQTIKKDSTGNYVQVPKQSESRDTGKTFTTEKGEVYKVYQSAKGNLYIKRRSKNSGKEYTYYLKVE